MSSSAGHIELDRAVASIHIGRRHRADLGDIEALAASIDREGLLQPPTITPEGMLVCGARRLAAIRQLGWRTVNVWVRSGLSDRLGQLVAEQDDNRLHKPLTQLEAAGLYRELKEVMAEDAARRKEATQFSTERQPGNNGPAESAGPSPSAASSAGALGTARQQAARMVTGTASYSRLEQIGYLQQLAEDPTTDKTLRAEVLAGLEQIEAGAPVNPIYEQVRVQAAQSDEQRQAGLDEMAQQALARVQAAKKTARTRTPAGSAVRQSEPARWPVRAFLATWTELADWWTHYDADHLATELTDEQSEMFLTVAEGTARFADHLRTARDRETTDDGESGPVRAHLRAL